MEAPGNSCCKRRCRCNIGHEIPKATAIDVGLRIQTLGLAEGHPIRQHMLHSATNFVTGVLQWRLSDWQEAIQSGNTCCTARQILSQESSNGGSQIGTRPSITWRDTLLWESSDEDSRVGRQPPSVATPHSCRIGRRPSRQQMLQIATPCCRRRPLTQSGEHRGFQDWQLAVHSGNASCRTQHVSQVTSVTATLKRQDRP